MKTIIAILAIMFLLALALYLGYDGVLLASEVTIIAGLGGYTVKKKKGG